MRYEVTTEELLSTAARLQDLADGVHAERAPLSAAADGTSGWCCDSAATGATAFFDTLAAAASGTAQGLRDLGRRTAAAGGAYDQVERGLIPLG